MKCDVLVVGASPAGLMAAAAAARAGSGVILLDRDLGRFGHAANTLFEGMARHAGLKIEDCYLQKELQGMRILSPCGEAATILARGYFLDRQRFDDLYLGRAEKAGVVLLRGAAQSIERNGKGRTVSFSEGEIRARVVVDASGVESGLSRGAGLLSMRHPEDIAWAIEATVQHPGLGEEMFFQYWIGSMAPGWKATFSPAGGDSATLAVFVRGHGQSVPPFFRGFLKMFKAYKAAEYRDIEDMKILSVRRGGDPIAVLPGQIVADSFMVTGGAAGQSGLAYSMRAGEICGHVAAQAVSAGDVSRKALSKYERQWKAEFHWEYRLARSALETLRSLDDREIDRLVRGLSAKTLVPPGSLLKKAAYAGAKVALVRPQTVFDLAWHLARG